MKFTPTKFYTFLVSAIVILTSCQKNKSTVPNYVPTNPPPAPISFPNPVANAGVDQIVVLPVTQGAVWPQGAVMLYGYISPTQNISSSTWSQVSGPNQSSFQINTSISILGNLVEGDYAFELRVKDGDGRTAKDTVNYHVTHDSLGGREFTYTVPWIYDLDDGIYAVISDSSVFYTQKRIMEVYIQLDGTSTWINVPFWNWYLPNSFPSGQAFYFTPLCPGCQGDALLIQNYSLDHQLINKPVKVKVKFL